MNKRYLVSVIAVAVLACGFHEYKKRTHGQDAAQQPQVYTVNVDGRMVKARLGDVVPGNVIGEFAFSPSGVFEMNQIVPVEVPAGPNKKVKRWGKITHVYKGQQVKHDVYVSNVYDVMIDNSGSTLKMVEAYSIGDIDKTYDIDGD